MSKNLILGPGHWGTGEMGHWGKSTKSFRNYSTEINERNIFAPKNSMTIAPTLQRLSAPSFLRIAHHNSFFGYQIVRKLSLTDSWQFLEHAQRDFSNANLYILALLIYQGGTQCPLFFGCF